MNLVDDLAREISAAAGLRIQQGWETIISETLDGSARDRILAPDQRAAVIAEIACRITVPETHFFRNHAQLAHCTMHLADVHEREGRPARLWCAGSATGEEPYTLAMLLHQRLGRSLKSGFELTACDLSSESVDKSRRATYTSWSFRGAPTWCLKYFENDGGSLRLAHHEIREAVKFSVQSCQEAARGHRDSSLDVVMFRNVAIYMEDWAISALHEQFARVLRAGGLLAIGPSDPQPKGNDFEFVAYYDNSPVFVRRDESFVTAIRPLHPHSPLASAVQESPPSQRTEAASPPMLRSDLAPGPPAGAAEISLLEALITAAPEEPTALRLLGQALLERGDAADAVQVLRQAVFLAAADELSRYFLALALRESGDSGQANRQLGNVVSSLSARSGAELLSDSVTTASALLQSARYLEGQWK